MANVVQYVRGWFKINLSFALKDQTQVVGSRWEALGANQGRVLLDGGVNAAILYIQVRQLMALLEGLKKEIRDDAESILEDYAKRGETYLGCKLEKRGMGGKNPYEEFGPYEEFANEYDLKVKELRKMLVAAGKKKVLGQQFSKAWFNPITGEEVEVTQDDGIIKIGGCDGIAVTI